MSLPCRTREKADALAEALGSGAEAAELADVAAGKVAGDVLMNSTSIGMHPAEGDTPVSAHALSAYKLVFDAVYTPLQTRLLRVCTYLFKPVSVPKHSGAVWLISPSPAVCLHTVDLTG